MWRKVTETDLNAALSKTEIDAYRRSADFDRDPVEAQIRAVCAYVRGCIRTGGVLKDAQMARGEDWLPESLVSPAMDYLRYQILTRMNVDVNESRAKAWEKADALFDNLRKGDFVPEADAAAGETAPEKATSPLSAPARPERLLD